MKGWMIAIYVITLLFVLAGCGLPSSTPANTPEPTTTPPLTETPTPEVTGEIVTANGVLIITRVERVDRFPYDCDPAVASASLDLCLVVAPAGHLILMVWLTSVDVTAPDLTGVFGVFDADIHVEDRDGNKAGLEATGIGLDEGYVGFAVLKDAEGWVLYWLDNDPIPLDAFLEVSEE